MEKKERGVQRERHEKIAVAVTDILVKHKVISPAEGRALIKGFKDSDKVNFTEFMLEEGLIDDVNILQAYSEYYQVPAYDVVGHFFETEMLRKFPKDVLLRNEMIPLVQDGNILIMVASEPDNPDLLSIAGEYVSYDIQFRVGLGRDICDAVKEFYDPSLTAEEFDEDLRRRRLLIEEEHRMEEDDEDDEEEEEFIPDIPSDDDDEEY